MVSGFNNSTDGTNGMGEIACLFQDAHTGSNFEYVLADVHSYDGTKTLISLGLLLKNGFNIRSDGSDSIFGVFLFIDLLRARNANLRRLRLMRNHWEGS